MRTTVEIGDALFKEAKLLAVAEGTTLKELITRGLELVLRAGKGEGFRLVEPPVKLSADSVLRNLAVEELARMDEEAEWGAADEMHR